MSPVYVIAGTDGETWYYLLPARKELYGAEWSADGQPMTRLDAAHLRYDDWYSHPGRAQLVVATVRGAAPVLRWRIRDESNITAKFPAELSMQEWSDRGGSASNLLAEMYEAVVGEAPARVVSFVGTEFVDLGVGDPPPHDGLTWVAKLPHNLEHQSQLHHLFPGVLVDFRAALAERLKQIPGVTAYDHAAFSVYASVPYTPPQFSWDRKGLRNVPPQTLTRHRDFFPPRQIPGNNRAEAAQKWKAEMADWVAVVTEMATARPCPECLGTGLGEVGKR
jgi:hypothetical protein